MPRFIRLPVDPSTPAVNKIIHHIWLGSAPGENVTDYVKAWAKVNDGTVRSDQSVGGPLAEDSVRYQSKVWVDRNALLVQETRDQINAWAEKKELRRRGIFRVEEFDKERLNDKGLNDKGSNDKGSNDKGTFGEDFSTKVAKLASRKRYELQTRIDALASRDLDDAERVKFIAELTADIYGKEGAQAAHRTLGEALARRRASIDAGLKQGTYQDINVMLGAPEHAMLRRGYLQELNLRQNMAAASDIARVVLLREQGGVYIDVDLLPRFNDTVLIGIARALAEAGYAMDKSLPDRWWEADPGDRPLDLNNVRRTFLEDVTDALVVKLKLISGYRARVYGGGEYFAAQQAILDKVVGDYVDAHIGSNRDPYSFFQPLGELRPTLGYEIAYQFNTARTEMTPNNNFIALVETARLDLARLDPGKEPMIDVVYRHLERVYAFFLSEDGQRLIENFSTGRNESEAADLERFAALWENSTYVALDRETYGHLLRYMQDGIVPNAGMTAPLTGPGAYDVAINQPDSPTIRPQSQRFNDNTVDSAKSSWWTTDIYLGETRKRMFPGAPPAPLDDPDLDPNYVPWQPPDEAYSNLIGEPGLSFNYEHQFVIQMEGSAAVADATFNLFEKHPQQSTYAQLRDGKLKVILGTREARAAAAQGEAANLSVDGPLRLTFVGHGKALDGNGRFAGMTAEQFLDVLVRLLNDGSVRSENKLVINLVACNLDNRSDHGTTSFARLLTDALPKALGALGLSPELTDVHVREGKLHVNVDGTKSQDHINYLYRDGSYVREAPYVEGSPGARFVASGLRNDTPSESLPGRDSAADTLIVVLGQHDDDLNTGAMLFNEKQRSSIYIQPDSNDTPYATVYIDEKTGRFRSREGLSRLEEMAENIRIHVVGAGTDSLIDPTFGGKSPSQMIELLGRLLEAVHPSAGGRISIEFSGRGIVDVAVTPEATFMGQFSEEFVQGLRGRGIDPSRVDLVTRIAHESTDHNGNRVFITPENKTLSGELGAAYAESTGAHFVYDPATNMFVDQPRSMSELGELNRRLHALHAREDLTAQEKVYLEEAGQQHLRAFRRAAGALPTHAEGRTVREQAIGDWQDVLKLREERLQKIEKLDFPEEEGWKLDPLRARKAPAGFGYEVGFVRVPTSGDVQDGEVKWVHTEESVFTRWADRVRELGQVIKTGVKAVGEEGSRTARYLFAGEGEPAAAHTVTAMFLMQALIGPERSLLFADEDDALATLAKRPLAQLSEAEKDALRHRLTYIRAQIGTNYAQLTSGLVMDGAHLGTIVQSLKDGTSHAASGMTKVASTLGALGVVFDLANIAFAGVDLYNASTVSEKTEAGFRLGAALAIAGCDIGALTAAYVASKSAGAAEGELLGEAGAEVVGVEAGATVGGSAATIAGVLGYIAVPLIGVSIGVGEVIKGFNAVAEKVDEALHKLEATTRAIRNEPVVLEGELASFDNDLVVTGLDMNTGVVHYGDVLIRALKKHWIGVPTPASDAQGNDVMLDMYAPFLQHDQASIDQADRARLKALQGAKAVILPVGLTHRYDFDLAASPGWRSHKDFPGLDALEQAYPEQFVWWTYSLFADYSPVKLRVHYSDTTFQLKLDAASREIVVPSVEQETYRNKLHYQVAGNGGYYTVVLPRWKTDVSLLASANPGERWFFDVSQAIRVFDAAGRSSLRAGAFDTVALTATGLSIGGEVWATFENGAPGDATIMAVLDDKGAYRLLTHRVDDAPDRVLVVQDFTRDLDAQALQDITGIMRSAGVHDSALTFSSEDGYNGVVDLQAQHWVAARFDAETGASTVYLDGASQLVLPGQAAVSIGVVHEQDDTLVTVLWQASPDVRVVTTYRAGTIVSVLVQASSTFVDMVFRHPDRLGVLGPLFNALPISTQVLFSDGLHKTVAAVWNGRVDLGDTHIDGGLQIKRYVHVTPSFELTLEDGLGEAVLRLLAPGAQSLIDVNQQTAQFEHIRSISLIAGEDGARVALDLTQGVFKGRKVTLMSNAPVDLTIDGDVFSWCFDGPDLVIRHGDDHEFRWINAGKDMGAHTLTIGKASPVPLDAGLISLEHQNFDWVASRQSDPLVERALEQARKLRERDWDKSRFVAPEPSDAYRFRVRQEGGWTYLMHRAGKLLKVLSKDVLVTSHTVERGSRNFFVAWKSSKVQVLADVSAYLIDQNGMPPRLKDVTVRVRGGDMLHAARNLVFLLGGLGASARAGDIVQLVNDDGGYATMRFNSAQSWTLENFAGNRKGVAFSFEREHGVLTVHDFDQREVRLSALLPVLNLREPVRALDLRLTRHTVQRKAIHIEAGRGNAAGDEIKLLSKAPLDLHILGGVVEYVVDGADLHIVVNGRRLVTWQDAGAPRSPAHTIQVDQRAPLAVADIIADARAPVARDEPQAAVMSDALSLFGAAKETTSKASHEVVAHPMSHDDVTRLVATERLAQMMATMHEPGEMDRLLLGRPVVAVQGQLSVFG